MVSDTIIFFSFEGKKHSAKKRVKAERGMYITFSLDANLTPSFNI